MGLSSDTKLKKKLTCLRHYNVEYPSQILENREKQKQRITEKNNCPEFKEMVIEKLTGRTVSQETREKQSQKHRSDDVKEKKKLAFQMHYGVDNYLKTEEWISYMKNGGAVYVASFVKNPSKPQNKTHENTKELYPEAILNYSVKIKNNLWYSLDIAVLSLRIDIEYDGSYYHQDQEKDKIRDENLQKLGWKILRYRDYIPTVEQLRNDINSIQKENENG
jgi:very-short-patch-repair endonuclease